MSEWQPIETAPRNGEPILVSDGEVVQQAYWVRSTNPKFAPGFWEIWECEPFNDIFERATHWQRLPEPPK